MNQRPDYILDIASLSPESRGAAPGQNQAKPKPQGRPWLAVHWKCCGTYSRIYRNKEATAYEGKCPSCGRAVHALIGADGTDKRFFEAS